MKTFSRLTTFCFTRYLLPVSIICVAILLLPSLMVYLNIRGGFIFSNRFETVLSQSGVPILLATIFVLYLLMVALSVVLDMVGVRSIYTLLAIPGGRSYLYTTKLLAALMWGVMILACGLLGIFISYSVYSSYFRPLSLVRYLLNNGLFLAFVRSSSLRLMLPLSLPSAALSILIGFGAVVSVLYASATWFWRRTVSVVCLVVYIVTAVSILGAVTSGSGFYRESYIALGINLLLVIAEFYDITFFRKGKVSLG